MDLLGAQRTQALRPCGVLSRPPPPRLGRPPPSRMARPGPKTKVVLMENPGQEGGTRCHHGDGHSETGDQRGAEVPAMKMKTTIMTRPRALKRVKTNSSWQYLTNIRVVIGDFVFQARRKAAAGSSMKARLFAAHRGHWPRELVDHEGRGRLAGPPGKRGVSSSPRLPVLARPHRRIRASVPGAPMMFPNSSWSVNPHRGWTSPAGLNRASRGLAHLAGGGWMFWSSHPPGERPGPSPTRLAACRPTHQAHGITRRSPQYR